MARKIISSGLETRSPGLTPKSGVSILAGNAVRLDPSDLTGSTITLADGGCGTTGFANESNVAPLSAWMFYDDVNRGGLISFSKGSMNIELFNDGRGDVFVRQDNYTPGELVYSNSVGLITVVAGAGAAIGKVVKAPASSTDSLIIESLI